MNHILHLFSRQTPDEAVAAVHQLEQRLSRDRFIHLFVSLDGHVAHRVARGGPDKLRVHCIPQRFAFDLTVGPRLRRFVMGQPFDLVHTWGLDATIAAAGALRGVGGPRVATLMTPPAGGRWSRWFQAVGPDGIPPIACPSGIVRRRVIEAGVAPEKCVVIRPGIDFHAVQEAKRLVRRPALSLPERAPVLLTLPTPTREGGHFYAAWATAILRHLVDDVRLIIPGRSAEQQRLRRFAATFDMPDLYMFPERRPFETLLAVADAVVVAAVDDVPSTPLAWAMAAGVPIVGSAVPAVTEYIADRSNGLLCKPRLPVVLARRIRTALEDKQLTQRVTDAARGQAFEVFSMRRSADQYRQLYENVLTDNPPGEKITDAAIRA